MISKKTINAIELCVLLASQRNAGYLATTDLSPRLGISISHLENILKPLRDCGLVAAIKGPGGGYMLQGDTALISVWDIACVFEKTLADAPHTPHANACASYELELEQVVMATLKRYTLSDFVDASLAEVKTYASALGRYKFKPLPTPFMPKAPNSVFQLHMSL